MEIFKVQNNGNEYEFVCSFKSTRSGFNHDCTMFVNGRWEVETSCHYINRTWESYNYQTVMLRAVGIMMEEREEFLKNRFKNENGYKQLTAKRKEEFQKILDADEKMMEYKAVKEKLRTRP